MLALTKHAELITLFEVIIIKLRKTENYILYYYFYILKDVSDNVIICMYFGFMWYIHVV